MGLKENLSQLYYSMEEQYYTVLDKVNEKVPVYSVVDPIDRVVPSFLVILGIVSLLVIGLVIVPNIPTGFVLPGSPSELTILVVNEEGESLKNAKVAYRFGDVSDKDNTDSTGQLKLETSVGSQVELIIEKRTYEEFSTTVNVDAISLTETITLISEKKKPTPKSITLTAPDGSKIENATVKIQCSTGKSLLQDTYEVVNGELTFVPPEDCGEPIIQSIESSRYSLANAPIGDGGVIELQGSTDGAYGVLNVRLKDDMGEFISEEANCSVSRDDGSTAGTFQAYYGEGNLDELEAGDYSVMCSATGRVSATKDFTISPGETTKVDLTLSEQEVATLTVQGEPGTVVIVRTSSNRKIDEATIGSNGSVSFGLGASSIGSIRISGQHESFITEPEETTVNSGDDASLSLNQITKEGNTNAIKVTVRDGSDVPLEGATLHAYVGQFICDTCESGVTDASGEALLILPLNETYKIYARKYPAAGWSDPTTITQEVKTIEMILTTGNFDASVTVVDGEGRPIPDMQVELFNLQGSMGTTLTDNDGQVTFTALEATGKWGVVVGDESTGYIYSQWYQAYPDTTMEFYLEKYALPSYPEITFLGTEEGRTRIKKDALIPLITRIDVPAGYTEARAVFTTATDESGEQNVDDVALYIDSVNGPIDAIVEKFETSKPMLGPEVETKNKAILATATLTNLPGDGTSILFNTTVKRPLHTMEDTSKFSYSVGVIDADESWVRDPVDTVLEDLESTEDKSWKYATKYAQYLSSGMEEVCDEDKGLCYMWELLNLSENLILEAGMDETPIYTPHKYSFSMDNVGVTEYKDAKLEVKLLGSENEAIVINSYEVTDADGMPHVNTGLMDDFEVEVSNLNPGHSIYGSFTFTPQMLGKYSIELKLIANNRVVERHTLSVNVVQEGGVVVQVEPEKLPALTPFTLSLNAIYGSETELADLPVEGADVRVEIGRKKENVLEGQTDAQGNFSVQMPATSPNQFVRIIVKQEGYESNILEMNTTDKIVDILFDGETLEPHLDISEYTELRPRLTINPTIDLEEDLTLKKIMYTGNLQGLIDEPVIANSFQALEGMNVSEGLSFDWNLKLTNEALQTIDEVTELNGNLLFTLEYKGVEYVIEQPYKILIGLGPLPLRMNCLEIIGDPIDTPLFGGPQMYGYTLVNNCVTPDGQPMRLGNVYASINWDTKARATVNMQIDSEPQIGLYLGPPKKILNTVDESQESQVLLTVTPMANQKGPIKFTIAIDAETITDDKQLVGETTITADTTIQNLAECLTLNDDPGIFQIQTKNGEAVVSLTNNCGENLDIELKKVQFEGALQLPGIAAMMDLRESITDKSSIEFHVKPEGSNTPAGGYFMELKAGQENKRRYLVKTLKFLLTPSPEDLIRFNKGFIKFLEQGGSQEAEVSYIHSHPVDVTAQICMFGDLTQPDYFDWTEAIGFGLLAGAAGGGYILASAFISIGAAAAIAAVLAVVAIIAIYLIFSESCEDEEFQKTVTLMGRVTSLDDLTGLIVQHPNVTIDKLQGGKFYRDPQKAETNLYAFPVKFTDTFAEGSYLDHPIQTLAKVDFSNVNIYDSTFTKGTITCGYDSGCDIDEVGSGSDKLITHLDIPLEGECHCNPGSKGAKTIYYSLVFEPLTREFEIPRDPQEFLECDTYGGLASSARIPRNFSFTWSELNDLESQGKIDEYCEEGKPCGSSQTAKLIVHKVSRLLELIKDLRNNNAKCPSPSSEMIKAKDEINSTPTNEVFLKEMESSFQGDDVRTIATIENDTTENVTAKVRIMLTGSNNTTQNCEEDIIIAPGAVETKTCDWTNLTTDISYSVVGVIDSIVAPSSGVDFDPQNALANTWVNRPTYGPQDVCPVPMATDPSMGGVTGLELWANENNIWGPYADASELRKDVEFTIDSKRAIFNKDFLEDFITTTEDDIFADAPMNFDEISPLLQYAADNDYFHRIYTPEPLIYPGLNDVTILLNVNPKDGALNALGELNPDTHLEVVFNNIQPKTTSEYWLDWCEMTNRDFFNHGVVVEPKGDLRGFEYITSSALGNRAYSFHFADPGELGAVNLDLKVYDTQDNIRSNANPLIKNLLAKFTVININPDGTIEAKLEINNRPITLLVARIHETQLYNGIKKYAYNIYNENFEIINDPQSALYWNATPNFACLGFGLQPIASENDVKATQNDKYYVTSGDWRNAYLLGEFDGVKEPGYVYYYTFVQGDGKIVSLNPALEFATPDTYGSGSKWRNEVEFTGTPGLNMNNINSLEDIYHLAEQKAMCSMGSDLSTAYYFNNKYAFDNSNGLGDFLASIGTASGADCILGTI